MTITIQKQKKKRKEKENTNYQSLKGQMTQMSISAGTHKPNCILIQFPHKTNHLRSSIFQPNLYS